MKNKTFVGLISIVTLFIYSFINNNEIIKDKSINKMSNNKTLSVEYIDVGQGDSILINSNNEYMLIDAGNNEDGDKLVNYFKEKKIDKFKYVIGTHAHEDHIGGMDNIINNFKIDTFYMPDCITTTKTFEEVLDALEYKNISFNTPKIDSTFNVGNAHFKVLYVGNDENDLNNTSIVLKMIYNNTSFLFTGDATSVTEEKIISKDIKADIIKIGHHGSQYSTSNKFLNKVNPRYAIISVGNDNTYGHPKNITLKKLNNIKTYRTDKDGTIIITIDGTNIKINSIKTDTNG